jgi:hypothetical protein
MGAPGHKGLIDCPWADFASVALPCENPQSKIDQNGHPLFEQEALTVDDNKRAGCRRGCRSTR